jgi:hypothetical protein
VSRAHRRDRRARGLLGALAALATLAAPRAGADEPIADNSFLVEEAYNQEPGVVQHISTLVRAEEGGDWAFSFTQEWPAPGVRHQLSYTLTAARAGEERGVGDVALNYRYQALGEDGGPVACAPRLSLLLPAGEARDGLGAGGAGVQLNLPLSVALGERWVGHWNLGGTHVPDAEAPDGTTGDLSGYHLAQGLVWLLRPKLNLLLEASYASARGPAAAGRRAREEVFLVSPGVRGAIDLASGLQVVPGLALPIGVGPSRGEWSLFAYLSLEHPFRK